MKIATCLLLLLCLRPLGAEPRDVALVDEVIGRIKEHFYDPSYRGVDLDALERQARREIASASGWDEKAVVVNRLLAALKTSHTTYYSPESKGYFEILGVFSAVSQGRHPSPNYDGIGMETVELPQGRFISGVWDGHPAEQAGLKVGDRILSVDGEPFHEIRSFQGKDQVTFSLESRPGATRSVTVPVISIDSPEAYEKALRDSARVTEVNGRKIGYVHVWSYAGQRYQDALQEVLCQGDLKDCDAAVVDLRDGWGGASPGYLNLFNQKVPRMEMFDNKGRRFPLETQWRKPVALLTNSGTRSGKEILAYAFRHYGLGKVVGTRTAGACVGGRPYRLDNGGVLYLAVADVTVDGKRLEGVGVEPDLLVDRPIPYAGGADPQRDAALRLLAPP